MATTMNERDADRLELLDRLADRIPELDLDEHETEWTTLPDGDGHEALLVDGGGLDGGSGAYFANAADDVHAVGSLQPLAPVVGCIGAPPNVTRQRGGGASMRRLSPWVRRGYEMGQSVTPTDPD